MEKRKILFLCTGNSCRSQMAEGIAREGGWESCSAGTKPEIKVNPFAVNVMAEIGIDISHQQSTRVSNDELLQYDLIITLCGDARDRCPILSNKNNHIHWGLEDPAEARGNDEEMMNVYRKVRDKINENIDRLL